MNDKLKTFAEQSGIMFTETFGATYTYGSLSEVLEKFAELVENQTHTNNKSKWYQEGYDAGQHDEREACVKLCEEVLLEYYGSELQSAAARCAYLISTRGEKL